MCRVSVLWLVSGELLFWSTKLLVSEEILPSLGPASNEGVPLCQHVLQLVFCFSFWETWNL